MNRLRKWIARLVRVSIAWGLIVVAWGLIASRAVAATVDINTADARALDRVLIGVGPAKAEAIVEYRRKNGLFRSAEDLAKVRGIGPKTVEKNRARIRVDESRAEQRGEGATGASMHRAPRLDPIGESRPEQRGESRPLIYRPAPTPRP